MLFATIDNCEFTIENPSMLSFIIPAHNEERLLGRTLDAIVAAASSCAEPFEIIVVDDASTDGTAAIARAHGAVVEQVALRKISAVRNAGAKKAAGDVLIFVDADTILPPRTLASALAALRAGYVAGGALVSFDEPAAYWGWSFVEMWNLISRLARLAAGCFIFARRSAFEAVGGFNEAYYAGEEVVLSAAIKSHGRLIILRDRVITSNRKAKTHGLLEIAIVLSRLAWRGPRGWQSREGLDLWYQRREVEPPG